MRAYHGHASLKSYGSFSVEDCYATNCANDRKQFRGPVYVKGDVTWYKGADVTDGDFWQFDSGSGCTTAPEGSQSPPTGQRCAVQDPDLVALHGSGRQP